MQVPYALNAKLIFRPVEFYTVPRIWFKTHRFINWKSCLSMYGLLQHTQNMSYVYTEKKIELELDSLQMVFVTKCGKTWCTESRHVWKKTLAEL